MEEQKNQENKDFSPHQSKEEQASAQQPGFDNIVHTEPTDPQKTDYQNNLSKFSQNNDNGLNLESQSKGKTETPSSSQPSFSELEQTKTKKTPVIIFLLIILAIIGIWYLNGDNSEEPQGPNQEENDINISVDNTPQDGTVNIISEEEWNQQQNSEQTDQQLVKRLDGYVYVMSYYNNLEKDPGLLDCSSVYPLERKIEDRYGADTVSAVIGLLRPLSEEEKQAGWSSAIPAETYLMEIKLENKTAKVYLAGEVANLGGSCAVTAVRAQLEQTLKQFSYVDEVVICINGNCRQDEILQP